MPLGRLGGLLVLGSCAFFAVTIVIGLTGGSISVGGTGPGGIIGTLGLVLLAAGAALLGIGGSAALSSRVARAGLVVAAGGLVAELATARVSVSSMLVFVFLLGGAVFGLGCVITVLGLLRSAGPQRAAALTILGGLLLGSIGSLLTTFAHPVPATDAPQPGVLGILAIVVVVAAVAVVVGGLVRVALLGVDVRPRLAGPEA
jgi:hypothetical protein